jgi:hypothetical protein
LAKLVFVLTLLRGDEHIVGLVVQNIIDFTFFHELAALTLRSESVIELR